MNLKGVFKNVTREVAECSPTIAAFTAAAYWSGADVMHLSIFSGFVFSGYRSKKQEVRECLKDIAYTDAPNKLQNHFHKRTARGDSTFNLKLVTRGSYRDGAFALVDKNGKKLIAIGENLYKNLPFSAIEFVVEHERAHFSNRTHYYARTATKASQDATGFSVMLSIVSGVSGPYAAGVTLLFAAGWLGQSLLTNSLSRKLEYKCDQGAVDKLDDIQGACQFFNKMNDVRVSYLFRSHPTHQDRNKRIIYNALRKVF